MGEYISREAAIKALSHGDGCGHVCKHSIERIPAADVVEVRHAYKIDVTTAEDFLPWCKCSECGYDGLFLEDEYCSRCGAKLDEVQNE